MSKETFKHGQAEAMKSRIELWAELGSDHFAAHSMWRVAIAAMRLSDAAERDEMFHQIHDQAIGDLANRGIMAEIYARRGDLGNGKEDSRYRVRIFERDGLPTGVERKQLGAYEQYVVRASAANLKPRIDVE